MYEEVYELCRNMENVMETYSKELLELDRGTVQYMIDEMQDEIDKQKKELEQAAGELKQKDAELEQQTDKIRQQESLIEQLTAELASLKFPSST
jgi:chromosome segregation ATPase